jgi:hypothetical protein
MICRKLSHGCRIDRATSYVIDIKGFKLLKTHLSQMSHGFHAQKAIS